jgi:hypothetical protein
MPEKNNASNLHDIALADIPTPQVEKYLQDWSEALERYKKFNNRSAIKEAQRLIGEFQCELETRRKESTSTMSAFPYKIGDIVYIEPAIREIHPLSPVAGKLVEVAEERYYAQALDRLARVEDKRYKNLVPVRYEQDNIWYVEEEYVSQKEATCQNTLG